MNTPPCAAMRRALTEFVGGDLGRERARRVAAHLAGCPACRCEASSLQQARKAVQSLRAVAPEGVDAAMFAALQRDTLAAVEVAATADERVLPAFAGRALAAAAAVALFLVGWWSVRQSATPTVFERQPIPIATAGDGIRPTALPWAGPRARLQRLGFDEGAAGAGRTRNLSGSGMMSRLSLRTLEDEILDPTGR